MNKKPYKVLVTLPDGSKVTKGTTAETKWQAEDFFYCTMNERQPDRNMYQVIQ